MNIETNELPEVYKTDKVTKGTYRWFLVTTNNPELGLRKTLETYEAQYAIGQLEKAPETGTIHVQAVCYFSTPIRVTHFKRLGHAIGIAAKDSARVINYCRKQASRVEDPIEIGTKPSTKTVADFDVAYTLVKEGRIAEIDPELQIKYLGNLQKLAAINTVPKETRHVRGVWIVGPPGAGKSYYVRNKFGPKLFIKSQDKWWCGYSGQRVALLDDLDLAGKCLGHYIKIWSDRWQCYGQIKGANVALELGDPHVAEEDEEEYGGFYVTSNHTIREIWGDDPTLTQAIERRFMVVELSRSSWDPEYAASEKARSEQYPRILNKFIGKSYP